MRAARAYLIETDACDVYGQMALDEALLDRAGAGGEPLFLLRFFRWLDRSEAVTFGFSQGYGSVLGAVRGRFGGAVLPLVRRSTGGGVVYHDGDLTFSLVFPWPRLSAASLIYKNIHLGVHLGLKARGIPSRLWSPPTAASGAGGVRMECFSDPESKDLVHEDGTKFLGGALRRRRGVGLYQGSLRPEGFGCGREALEEAVKEGLSLQWRAAFVPREPAAAEAARAASLRRGKYALDSWNKRK